MKMEENGQISRKKEWKEEQTGGGISQKKLPFSPKKHQKDTYKNESKNAEKQINVINRQKISNNDAENIGEQYF